MRPRDAILFLNECLSEAIGKENITMDDLYAAEKRYSLERLKALRDEWKDPYMDIDKVFEQFRNRPRRFTSGVLSELLDRVAELVGDSGFLGRTWLEPLCEVIWAIGSDKRTWVENYGPLVDLLYNIGFLGIVRGQKEAVYSYEEQDLLVKTRSGLENLQFEIHPAFQQALNITHTDVWHN
jgi:hypothetical protein